MRDSLNQEAYAYELNGKMYIYEAEEFYKLISKWFVIISMEE